MDNYQREYYCCDMVNYQREYFCCDMENYQREYFCCGMENYQREYFCCDKENYQRHYFCCDMENYQREYFCCSVEWSGRIQERLVSDTMTVFKTSAAVDNHYNGLPVTKNLFVMRRLENHLVSESVRVHGYRVLNLQIPHHHTNAPP